MVGNLDIAINRTTFGIETHHGNLILLLFRKAINRTTFGIETPHQPQSVVVPSSLSIEPLLELKLKLPVKVIR